MLPTGNVKPGAGVLNEPTRDTWPREGTVTSWFLIRELKLLWRRDSEKLQVNQRGFLKELFFSAPGSEIKTMP